MTNGNMMKFRNKKNKGNVKCLRNIYSVTCKNDLYLESRPQGISTLCRSLNILSSCILDSLSLFKNSVL